MLHIQGECPHCMKECGFDIYSGNRYASAKTEKELIECRQDNRTFGLSRPQNMATLYCSGLCVGCGEPVLLIVGIEDENLLALRESINVQGRMYQGNDPEILHMYPEPKRPWAHPALPPEVGTAFADLQRMVWHAMTPPFILSGCRTVLELSCDVLGAEGKTLLKRLENLRDQNVLTGVLYEWATQIRLSGNAAVHDFEGTAAEAEEMVEFTKLFLQYVFELPARVKEARAAEQERR